MEFDQIFQLKADHPSFSHVLIIVGHFDLLYFLNFMLLLQWIGTVGRVYDLITNRTKIQKANFQLQYLLHNHRYLPTCRT